MILIFTVLANFIFHFFILYYPTGMILIVQLFRFSDLSNQAYFVAGIHIYFYTNTYVYTHLYTHTCIDNNK